MDEIHIEDHNTVVRRQLTLLPPQQKTDGGGVNNRTKEFSAIDNFLSTISTATLNIYNRTVNK